MGVLIYGPMWLVCLLCEHIAYVILGWDILAIYILCYTMRTKYVFLCWVHGLVVSALQESPQV